MAAVAGTTTRFTSVGQREDLEDMIWKLYPEDTWALSNLPQVRATSVLHEWQSDSLAGATSNRQLEGDDASYATASPTVRLNQHMQISRKTFIVSGSLQASDHAGRRDEIARLGTKLMVELKRDMEQAVVGNQASSAGSISAARSSAGMESWIAGPTQDPGTAGNAVRSTTTANTTTTPGWNSNAVAAPTDGTTTGALSKSALDSALEGAWSDGGNPRVILCGATNKAGIDGFSSVATRFVDVDRAGEASIIGSVSVYVSDFGRHTVVLHRYVRGQTVLCLDPEYWAVAFYRRPFMESLAKTGDAEKRQMLAEFGVVARAPGTALGTLIGGASSKVVATTG